jgi:hypothetical protein
MNINASTTLYLDSALTNFGTVTWTNKGNLDVRNGSGAYAGLIQNEPGALWDIQNDQSLFNNAGGVNYFNNAGTLRKSAHSGVTMMYLPITNSGTVEVLQGNLNFSGGLTTQGGTLLFGLGSPTAYGAMTISGAATLGGTFGVEWLNGFVAGSGNSFTVLNYGSFTGSFTNFELPPGPLWVTNYGPTAFVLSVASIDHLVFTTQPVGGVRTNVVLAPVVVQIEDPGGNTVATSGLVVTLSLANGGSGLQGTLSRNTDATGKATFNDLSVGNVGTVILRATAATLTAGVSNPFQIVPVLGGQYGAGGFLLELNGTNNRGAVIIYASTNLTAWAPIYTNAPTNGPIWFLDSAATNDPFRFYSITGY